MASVLSKLKNAWKRDCHPSGDSLINAVSIEQGVANAKRANPTGWKPPEPSLEEKLLCLERWYYFVKQKQPDLVLAGEELLRLEPSGLGPEEMRQWYWGLRQEAVRRILVITNSSYTRTAIHQQMENEGLANALSLMDPGTRESYEGVIKYLSD
ncbi:MAG: hypothetical protein PHU23_12000 [Dehalococcoidales bacterium]|nr:hypothetical protein [Dehalococcoidales bacterium]